MFKARAMGCGILCLAAAWAPSAHADEPPGARLEAAAPERASIHFISTFATQYHPAFFALYSGTNSLKSNDESATAFVSSLGTALRLWQGGELVFNPEISGGFGLSKSLGVAAFPSGIVYRVGSPAPTIYVARLFLRHVLGLGGGKIPVEPGMNQLAGMRDRNALVFTVGRLSVEDTFDGNAYAHDPTTSFFNWALFASGAWDYPADTRGYTWGAIAELSLDDRSVRAGIALEPKSANAEDLEWDITKARGLMAEYEQRWEALGGHGSARVTPFLNEAHMGSYAQVLSDPAAFSGQVQPTRAFGRKKYGVAVSADQQLTSSWGAFIRASMDDGATETWAFTEIDRSLALGLVNSGRVWGGKSYQLGAAVVINGLSGLHRAYLAQGGYGFILGDGRLNYAPEMIGDFYARVEPVSWLQLSIIYQPIVNPAYNHDRGPVHVFSGRLRAAF